MSSLMFRLLEGFVLIPPSALLPSPFFPLQLGPLCPQLSPSVPLSNSARFLYILTLISSSSIRELLPAFYLYSDNVSFLAYMFDSHSFEYLFIFLCLPLSQSLMPSLFTLPPLFPLSPFPHSLKTESL